MWIYNYLFYFTKRACDRQIQGIVMVSIRCGFCEKYRNFVFCGFLKRYPKVINLINNYWMRLGMITRMIQTEVNVICQSEDEAENFDGGLNWFLIACESRIQWLFYYTLKDIRKFWQVVFLQLQRTKSTVSHFVYFCLYILLCLGCWPRWGLGTTASNNFGCKFDKRNYYWTLSTSAAEIT